MKHFALYIVFLLSSVLVWAGCDFLEGSDGLFSGTPSLSPRYLNVTPSSLSFAADQPASQSVSITSLKTPWLIDNSIEWITLSQTSGESSASVNVSAAENANAYARTGIFMVSSTASDWNYDSDVSVSQAAAVPYIKASQSALTLAGAAGSATVDVTANCTYSISSSADWLSFSKSDNSLTLTAAANETDQYRTGVIILSFIGDAGSATAKVIVTQAPASITASSETLMFEASAGEKHVEVSAEADWTASTSYSWIEVSPAAGAAGTSSLQVSVIPNTSTDERTGYVVLAIGSKQRIQIPVRQRGLYIEADTLAHDFGAAGERQALQIRSNTDWQISSLPSWVKVDRDNGSGNAEIQVKAEENPYTTARSGQFVVSQPGLSLQSVVTVRQVGKTFDVAAATLYFGQKSGSQTLDITTDGTWRATTEADWIQIALSSATGSSVLSVSVSANDTETERSGEIVITMANASATIAVVQKGKYFTIDNPSLAFASRGGQLVVSLATNVAWTARIEEGADWLSVTPASGDSLAEVTVTAADNPSVLDRTAHVYFDVLGRSVDLVVTQRGRYLTVDATELLFYAKGGTSEAVTVSTDGAYTVSTSDSWFTITRSGGTFTVTAEENTTSESRTGYITLTLTDLAEGEYSIKLPITQSYTTGNAVIDNLIASMVYVEGGTFTMGATSEQGSDAESSELPTHSVTLSNYEISKHEVTQAEWQAVMGNNPSFFTGEDNLPVEQVSWDDCQTFITKLNTLTGKTFRLPTEAEWEYAARGGNKSKGYKYAGSDNIDDVAWYAGNSGDRTHAVGTKQPNELGLYDMSGNVYEWCGDLYGGYSSDPQTNPTGATSGSVRVDRGGCWYLSAGYSRVSYRFCSAPSNKYDHVGLRLVLEVKPLTKEDSAKLIIDNLVSNMVYVEGGTFTMGATSEQGSDVDNSRALPTHSVTLSSFSIGKYEVSQAEWQAVMGNNPSSFTSDDNLPVEQVSLEDCQTFITKLNTLTGKNFRLPTEAEWEYAARGGNKSQGYKYAGSNNVDDVSWYESNSESKTHAVGTKQPNELGLYDMIGNVWEWCSDLYDSYSSSSQTNPTGATSGVYRVLRGGCYGNYNAIRVCDRLFLQDCRANSIGLRLVLSQIAEEQEKEYFTINNTAINFTSQGGQFSVPLSTNVTWIAQVEEGVDWLTITPISNDSLDEVIVTAVYNTSALDRSTHVYIDALGRSVDLVVTQKGRYLTVDATELVFYAKGGTSEAVTVSTDRAYTISTSDSWFTVTRSGDTFTVTAEENTTSESRTGYVMIAFTDGAYSFKLPITQSYTTSNAVIDNLIANMVYVEGGTFTMGATSEQGSNASGDELPTHSVTLSNYKIGKYEVTQAEWETVMGSNPSHFTGDDNLPVEWVSLDDCQTFITKLNTLTGKNFRLPTEAEWEYAARGGNKGRGYKYAGSNNIDDVAWYDDNSGRTTHAVGAKQPNELGLYDMSGNVLEWCSDFYGSYSSSPQINPTGVYSGSYYVLRGGSWFDLVELCRVSHRDYFIPDYRSGNIGLRLVLSE